MSIGESTAGQGGRQLTPQRPRSPTGSSSEVDAGPVVVPGRPPVPHVALEPVVTVTVVHLSPGSEDHLEAAVHADQLFRRDAEFPGDPRTGFLDTEFGPFRGADVREIGGPPLGANPRTATWNAVNAESRPSDAFLRTGRVASRRPLPPTAERTPCFQGSRPGRSPGRARRPGELVRLLLFVVYRPFMSLLPNHHDSSSADHDPWWLWSPFRWASMIGMGPGTGHGLPHQSGACCVHHRPKQMVAGPSGSGRCPRTPMGMGKSGPAPPVGQPDDIFPNES